MCKGEGRRWRATLLLELLAWALVCGAFLSIYVGRFEATGEAALAHVGLLAPLWLGLVGLRMLLWKLLPGKRPVLWLAAVLTALPWLALVSWYLLVLLGLSSWGRVTTWPLIRTYALQSGPVIDTLAIPGWIPVVVVLAVPAGCVLLLRYWFSPHDWTRVLAQRLSSGASLLIGLLLCSIFPARLLTLADHLPANSQEPLRLSFLPQLGVQRQSHVSGSSPLLDAAEAAARESYRPSQPAKPLNIILIVGDALRADHMGMYGYARPTTPFLDQAVASANAAVLPRMRSTCAESTCGLLSLATSRTVEDLPNHPITLQEVLRRHGYQVHMLLGGDHTNFYGLKEAYGPVDSYHDGSTQRRRYMNDDRLVVDQASALPPFSAAQPTMLQFHLMSTHGLGLKRSETFRPFTNYYLWPQENRVARSRDEALQAINYYDNGMVQFDAMTAQLLDILRSKGYLDSALVIITGDHGEMLGEHGLFGHRQRVEEGVLSVPFLLLRYGYQGLPLTATGVASQIDVAPTVLADIGLPQPSTWRGQPLQSAGPARLVHFQQGQMAGVYAADGGAVMKYWKNFKDGSEYAFDIASDPSERRNLILQRSPGELDHWRKAVAKGQLIIEAPMQ